MSSFRAQLSLYQDDVSPVAAQLSSDQEDVSPVGAQLSLDQDDVSPVGHSSGKISIANSDTAQLGSDVCVISGMCLIFRNLLHGSIINS